MVTDKLTVQTIFNREVRVDLSLEVEEALNELQKIDHNIVNEAGLIDEKETLPETDDFLDFDVSFI